MGLNCIGIRKSLTVFIQVFRLLEKSVHHLGPWHKSKHQRPGLERSGKWIEICSPKRWFSVFKNGGEELPSSKRMKTRHYNHLLTCVARGFWKPPLKTLRCCQCSHYTKWFISKVTIQSDFRFRVVNDRSSCNELASLWICGPNLGPSWPWCRYDVWVNYDSYLSASG